MTTRFITPGAISVSQSFASRLGKPWKSPSFAWLKRAGRLVQLCASIASLVLGLMVLIPVGVAISPLVLAYSRLASGR